MNTEQKQHLIEYLQRLVWKIVDDQKVEVRVSQRDPANDPDAWTLKLEMEFHTWDLAIRSGSANQQSTDKS